MQRTLIVIGLAALAACSSPQDPTTPRSPGAATTAAHAIGTVGQADMLPPAGPASAPSFKIDPCGRQPGFDYAPQCGTVCADSDGVVVNSFGVNGTGTCDAYSTKVTCPPCPGGAQCGATGLTDPYIHTPYANNSWCIVPCTSSQHGQTRAVSPAPDSEWWGAYLNCP
jgi:hypothetical protein